MAKDKAKAKNKDKGKTKEAKASSKKGGKDLTPLEKARLARAAGKGKTKAKKKNALPIFKAPADFKPFFMKVGVLIDKDGILTDMKATRVKGSITNENAKTVDMLVWDPDVVRRLFGRYSALAFVRNVAKRLPPGMATLVMRVSANRETSDLRVSIKDIKFREGKDGKFKVLDKKDAKYRLLRKPGRFLPAAFTKVKDFPTTQELKAMNKAEEDEDDQVLVKKSTGKKVKVEKTKKKSKK